MVARKSNLFDRITENTIKTPFGKMQVVDEFVIQDDDKVTFCQKAREKYNELDKDGWFDSRSNEPYWYAFPYNRAKFTLCVSKSLGKVCFIDYRKEGKDILFEGRVFSHSSGFGLSGHYGYKEPKKEPLYIATETNEDDGELYFDEEGNTTEFETDAKRFTSEEDALEFAKNNVIFGEPGTKLFENMEKNTMKNKLNEKRIEIPNPYPVKKEEIIDLVERSTRLTHTATDSKTVQLYIYSNGNDRPEAFAEVEITSAGYILHGAEGYDYQGSSFKEFENDLRDVIFNFDTITSRRFGESVKKNTMKNKLNEDGGLFKPFAGMALTMAALTAIGIQNKNFDEKCKAIADELGVKLGKNAFDQRGSAYYMPYLQSFKYDGGSKDYGMTPEGLCKYIRKTANVDNVEYKTVDGGVEILFVDRYSVNIGNVIHRREARGSFFVPNDYFEVSFIFNESTAKRSAIKESLTFEDTIRTRIHIESEEDLEDTPFEYYLDADIGDTVYICEDADVYMREDKNGWVIFWHNKFMEHIPLSLLDRDDEEACNAKYRQAQKRYKAICNAALDGTLEKELSGNKNRKPSFDYSNASEVFKQFGESYNKSRLFDKILNESSPLKENKCSLEQLLSKAYVSEYRMVSKNSAIVRVKTSPALLTSDSMAARFEEDIPDGYELEVEYLGEDPILGKNLDIYEVQLLKN